MSGSAPPGAEEAEDERREAEAREAETEQQTIEVGASVTERFVAALTSTSVLVTLLALLLAIVVGALIIALSTEDVREALGYLTARPSDTFTRAWDAIFASYSALADGALGGVRELGETLTASIPLVLAGLAVAIPLRASLFNIGGEGQVLAGGLAAGLVGFSLTGWPILLHLPLALLAAVAGGALLGWIPGILKARTGAHEVITTIMLNNIMIFLTDYLLTTSLFQQPGRSDPISKTVVDSARLPNVLGGTRLHLGILVMILMAVAAWWLLNRSSAGFEMTAVGLNPNAATTAGMSVARATVLAMVIGGAMAGLAGSSQILGLQFRITGGFSAGLGFDGITVALLGRGSVGGTVMAGLLFGALKAGGLRMQATAGTSLDLVVVIQALIILFIAAPALVRAVFRIRTESAATTEVAKGWGS